MHKLFCTALAVSLGFSLTGLSAQAETKLNLRGGVALSQSEYPYAIDDTDGPIAITAGYGEDFYGYAALSTDNLFGGYGAELSLSHIQVQGSDSVGDIPGDADCDPFILDAISISHSLCMDGADTASSTRATQLRLMATHDYASGLQVLGGLGALDFHTSSHGMMYYPDEFSEQSRSGGFEGIGLVLGARKTVPIPDGANLKLEGFVGAYHGDRSLQIDDDYLGDVGTLTQTRSDAAFSLDLTASIAMPADRIASGGKFEIGVAYTRLFDVVDTSNYNTAVTINGPEYQTGSRADEFDALSFFVGFELPL